MEFEEFLKHYEGSMEEGKQSLLSQHTHCLIQGTAGTGKTTLLKVRSAYLVECEGVDADLIWNITNDGRNAKRMAREYRHTFDEVAMPHFMDLRALAYKIIKMDHEGKGIPVWPAYRNLKSFVRKICKEMFALTLSEELLEEVLYRISYCKNMLLSDTQIEKIKIEGFQFPAFYKMYEKTRKAKQFYDSDDVIVEALCILQSDEDVRDGCHHAIHYLHLDDAQEVSFAGHMLLRLLCGEDTQLFAVADKLQCSNKRNCAFPDALDTLDSAYPGLKSFTLETNYRNASMIGDVIQQFTKKEVSIAQEEQGDVKFKGFTSMERIYTYALEAIQNDLNGEHVFLYRNEEIALPLIDILMEHNIPFYCSKSVSSLLKQSILQDMVCFVRLLSDANDLEAFIQINEHFHLEIPQRVLLELAEKVRGEGMDVYQALTDSSLRAVSKKKLAGKMEKIRLAAMKDTLGMLQFVLKEFNYRAYFEKQKTNEKNPAMLVLYTMAERYPQPQEFIKHMEALADFSMMELSNVKICSVEESKGNEYDHVYIMDCMNTLFPKTDASDPFERHLFYIAMTRALKHLEFFTFKKAAHVKMELSSFLFEIYQQQQKDEEDVTQEKQISSDNQPKRIRLADLKRGKKIVHTTLGLGRIMKISDGMMHVQFAQEAKTLNAKLCIQNDLISLP